MDKIQCSDRVLPSMISQIVLLIIMKKNWINDLFNIKEYYLHFSMSNL